MPRFWDAVEYFRAEYELLPTALVTETAGEGGTVAVFMPHAETELSEGDIIVALKRIKHS